LLFDINIFYYQIAGV